MTWASGLGGPKQLEFRELSWNLGNLAGIALTLGISPTTLASSTYQGHQETMSTSLSVWLDCTGLNS